MALTVGTNSWVTIAEADTYLADKYGAGDWAGLTNAVKSQLLITAFWSIYGSAEYTIAKSSTAELVKNAQIELAWYFYGYDSEIWKRLSLQGLGVQEFEISKFRERFTGDGAVFPPWVAGMLAGFLSVNEIATFSRELD